MRLVFILLLLLSGCSVSKHSSITNITKYSELSAKLITPQTIILIDIDNTIFRAASHYGSVEHFEYLLHNETENLSKHQISIKFAPKWIQAQELVHTKLIDKEINEFLIKYKSITNIIAFTARPPYIGDLTYSQLVKHKVFMSDLPNFSFLQYYYKKIFPDDQWCKKAVNIMSCNGDIKSQYFVAPALFHKGILFAHDLNHKGEVFKDFFNQYIIYAMNNNLPVPNKVIFIDDKMYNLQSMKLATKDLNLDYYGVRMVDDFKFDIKQAKEEEKKYLKQSS